MNTYGLAPSWGSRWKSFVHENAARWRRPICKPRPFPTKTSSSIWTRRRAIRWAIRCAASPLVQNEARAAEFGQKKMEEWFQAAGAFRFSGAAQSARGFDARLRRHAHGRQSRNQRRRSLGIFARSAESRRPGRVRDGNERRAQSHAYPASAGLADRRASGEELEIRLLLEPCSSSSGRPPIY